MELVEFFKDEVNSIVDHRPPVSKAKMVQITRAAIKATRFYKHVVMAVERFIERCPPEYKVAGLYVIDSIVRQSRHANGRDRDIFGPRFSRNLQMTFDNLFSGCLLEDRPRIVRVLNLWQKNGVFTAKTIQPLLDLGSSKVGSNAGDVGSSLLDDTTNSMVSNENDLSQNISVANTSASGVMNNSNNLPSVNNNNSNSNNNNSLRISKSVLDFDYGEDDDDDADETPTEAEPPLSSTLNKIGMEQRRSAEMVDNHSSSSKYHSSTRDAAKQSPTVNQMSKSNEPDPVLERWNKLMKGQSDTTPPTQPEPTNSQNTQSSSSSSYSAIHRDRGHNNNNNSHGSQIINNTSSTSSSSKYKHTARPMTPSSKDSPKTKSSSPSNNHHHHHSSSSSSSKSRTNNATEKEADRKRKCFPRIKDRHVTLCSSTFWLGHVPKSVTEADISDAFGEFGTINSIDLIPPRGCAYICMDRRQDAKMALHESRDMKLKGSRIKMAWAPGKGLKEYKDLKDYFELDIGCAFIPYSKITSNIEFDILEEGGVIDEDSMSMEMIELRQQRAKEKLEKKKRPSVAASLPVSIMPQMMPQSLGPQYHHLPATSMSNTVPPPSAAWVHGHPGSNSMNGSGGGIPFPPPRLPVTASATTPSTSSSSSATLSSTNGHQPPIPIDDGTVTQKLEQNGDESIDKSPISLEHKISITEQQINMVEQQLSMMQQSQMSANMGHLSNQMGPPHLLNHQVGPFGNPMIFDMNLQGLGPIPPRMPMFAGPPPSLFGHAASLLPMGQSDDIVNMNLDGSSMQHYGGDRY